MKQHKLSSRLYIAIIICLAIQLPATLLFADHEVTESKTFKVKKGQTLTIDADLGSIEVEGWNRNEVFIEVTKRTTRYSQHDAEDLLENFEVEYSQTSNGVYVEARHLDRTDWFGKSRNLQVRFTIKVPVEFDLDLKTAGGSIAIETVDGVVDAKTSGGSISGSNIGGDANLKTSGGSIKAIDVTGSVVAKSSGGGIHLDTIGGDARGYTSGGSLKFKQVQGEVDGSTSGGGIYAEALGEIKNPFSLKTSGGGITLKIRKDTNADIDASTSGGGVDIDLPITVQGKIRKNKIRGSINDGGPMITLRTSGGGIHIDGI